VGIREVDSEENIGPKSGEATGGRGGGCIMRSFIIRTRQILFELTYSGG
jgi:hypothetical protein